MADLAKIILVIAFANAFLINQRFKPVCYSDGLGIIDQVNSCISSFQGFWPGLFHGYGVYMQWQLQGIRRCDLYISALLFCTVEFYCIFPRVLIRVFRANCYLTATDNL